MDFDLVDAFSPAVYTGAPIAGNTLDFFNRTRPNGNAPDIGALEFGSCREQCLPRIPYLAIQPASGLIQPALFSQEPVELPRIWDNNQ